MPPITPQSLAAVRSADASKDPTPIQVVEAITNPGAAPIQSEEINVRTAKTLALIVTVTFGVATVLTLRPKTLKRVTEDGTPNEFARLTKLDEVSPGVDNVVFQDITLTAASLGAGPVAVEIPAWQVGNAAAMQVEYEFDASDGSTVLEIQGQRGF